jgi:hypothetical protein
LTPCGRCPVRKVIEPGFWGLGPQTRNEIERAEAPASVIRPRGGGCERCRCCRTSSGGSALRLRAGPSFFGSFAHRTPSSTR